MPFDLDRFLAAQDPVLGQVRRELAQGRKQTHWIWFVFPQIEGLGLSAISQHYSITCLDEARAYLDHPVLGPRLVECAEAINAVHGRSALEVFGAPDDLKLRSSLTLFAHAAPDTPVFAQALAKYFAGEPDRATLEKLGV